MRHLNSSHLLLYFYTFIPLISTPLPSFFPLSLIWRHLTPTACLAWGKNLEREKLWPTRLPLQPAIKPVRLHFGGSPFGPYALTSSTGHSFGRIRVTPTPSFNSHERLGYVYVAHRPRYAVLANQVAENGKKKEKKSSSRGVSATLSSSSLY